MNENIHLEEHIEDFTNILTAQNQHQSLLDLSSLNTAFTGDDSAPGADSAVMKKYFDSPLTSDSDKNVKKITMAATLLAKQKGTLPDELKNLSTEKLFGVMDSSLNQMKIAYQYAQGQFADEEDAFEQLLDASAARVKTLIDSAIPSLQQMASVAAEQYLPQAINTLMDAVDSAYPQAKCITTYVRLFSPAIARAVKPAVKKGVELLGTFAKYTIDVLADTGKSLWRYAKNWLNS